MNKAMCLIVGLFLGIGIMLALYMTNSNRQAYHLEKVYVEGDEMPGIGGDEEQPDTCVIWYSNIDQNVHIEYPEAWLKEHPRK